MMKKTLLLLFTVVILGSVNAQQSDPNNITGNWFTQRGDNNSIELNFMNSNKLYFSLGSTDGWKGNYNYKIGKSNTTFVIMLRSDDSTRKDTFQIMLTRISDEEYKLSNIFHTYDDGRPPESELFENKVYILKKGKK
jgi:hypothetical protein